jgi:hypothetical protein
VLERLRKKLGLALAGSLCLEHMDQDLFLELAYRLVLNRPPDPHGRQRFKEDLASGALDRPGVMQWLLTSPEAAFWNGPSLPPRVAGLETNQARELRRRYGQMAAPGPVAHRLFPYEYQVCSQHGEDGVILHLLSQLAEPLRRFVEFGASDGRECCAANLALNFGWQGLFLERDPALARSAAEYFAGCAGVRVDQAAVNVENINQLIARGGMEGEIDLLSVDIDGNDYWVWQAVNVVRPRLVVVEYNGSLGPEAALSVPYDPEIDRFALHPSGFFHGASLAALAKLGREKGYILVGCESSGINAFFLHEDLAGPETVALRPAEAFVADVERGRACPPEEQARIVAGLPFQEV